MGNILNINSANILTFGFTSKFDLLAKTLTFDITGLTAFNTGGAANVVGIAFSVIDPSGLAIASIDWSAPAIDPTTETQFVIDLVSGFAQFGYYKIIGVIRDQDNQDYTITITKEICQPEGFTKDGYIKADFELIADCNTPKVSVTDHTKYILRGKYADTIIKDGLFTYPPDTLDQFEFDFTPFNISGDGKIFTGRYIINNTSVATYDLLDGVYVLVSYKLINYEKVVNCNSGLVTVLCCIDDLSESYENDPYSSNGIAIKKKLDQINIPLMRAVVREKAGQDSSDLVAEIADILNCDCNCSSDAIEAAAITSGGVIVNNLVINGVNAANVTNSTAGSTTTYVVNVKNVVVANSGNDTAFNITKVVTDNAITFNLTFNYTNLANTILETIQGSDELTILLKQIVGDAAAGISLDGLDGGCVITLSNCSYLLVEANNGAKTITSITIDNVVRNAPGGLLLSNVSAVASWLNGLSLGTFTVVLDGTATNVIITSNANAHVITVFNMTTTAGALIRQFSRTCIGLVDFLNAIVDYVCALDAAKVVWGVADANLCSFADDGTVLRTEIAVDTTLDVLIASILTAQCALYDKMTNITINCAYFINAFQPSTAVLKPTDGLFGLKNNACARVLFPDLAAILLTAIAGSTDLKTQFCNIVASCVAPFCAPPTNVSGVLTSSPTCVPVTGATGSVS